jgi:type IV pilus assembly protein PilV
MADTHADTKKENGVTLLEILLTISILTVGILAVASMQISATGGNALSSHVTEATAYAADRIEKLLGSSYASLVDPDGDGTNQDADDDGVDDDGGNFGLDDATVGTADGVATFTNEQGTKYNLSWNVAVDEPRIGTKTIRVIVVWTARGVQKSISLNSVKADM